MNYLPWYKYGKSFSKLMDYIERIKAGQNAIFLSPDFVVIPTKEYERLISLGEPEIRVIVDEMEIMG